MDKKETQNGILAMISCAALWSLGGICIKMISWNALTIACIRGLIATIILFVFMKRKGYGLKFNKYTWMISCALVVCMTLFVFANKLTTAANAIVIQYLCPVWILIIGAVFFKQKIKKMDAIVTAICIGGIILFFLDQLSPGNILGNVLAIMAGVGLATMFTGNTMCGDTEVQYTGIMMGHFLTFVIGLGGFFLEPFHTTSTEIMFILILGIFQMGLPYVIFAYASARLSALACSLIGMLEPMLNPILVAIFYGEVPGMFALFGGAVIIVTTSVWLILQSRTPQTD